MEVVIDTKLLPSIPYFCRNTWGIFDIYTKWHNSTIITTKILVVLNHELSRNQIDT